MYIYLILAISLLSFINAQVETRSSISLRFNKTGEHRIINTTFYKVPNRIYINGVMDIYGNIQTLIMSMTL